MTPGVYDLAFLDCETVRLYGGRAQKLVLRFRVVTLGKFFGTILPRYYNVTIKGKAQKYGQFTVGWKSDFIREYVGLFGGAPKRKDRIPMSVFEKVIISGAVRRVTRSGTDHRVIPKDLQYSVIRELLKVKEL